MIFVSFFDGTSKKGNPVKVLTLSDGLRSVSSFMPPKYEHDEELVEGDEVDVEIEVGINFRSEFDVTITAVTPA